MNTLIVKSNDHCTKVIIKSSSGELFDYAILWHEGQTVNKLATVKFFSPVLPADFDDIIDYHDTKLWTITPMHKFFEELYYGG
jgi:hypothetical protein